MKTLLKKVTVPEGYVVSKVQKVKHPNHDAHKILAYYALCACDYNALLPKGYMTKVRNGNICYESAVKYAKKALNNAGNPFALDIVRISNDTYFVITFLKVA